MIAKYRTEYSKLKMVANKKMGKKILISLPTLSLFLIPLFITSSIWAAPCQKQPVHHKSYKITTKATILTPIPAQISQGSVLVISSNKDDTFSSQLSDNEVVFTVSKNQKKSGSERPEYVSPDGRVISVLVPNQALPGEIILKRGNKSIGKVTINITETILGKCISLIAVSVPLALVFILLLILGIVLWIDKNWKLGDALSESEPVRDKDGNVLRYPNSASRLIAFIGLFAIIAWGMGILVPATYRFAQTGEVPDLSGFSKFLVAQAGIFTPYIANKIAGAFKKSH